jgi:PAS domain S-box-containing protein
MVAAPRGLRYLALLGAFAGATAVRWLDGPAVTHALVWLPSGVAIAGLWLLGLRAAWVVAAVVVTERLANDYTLPVAAMAGIGTTAEAVLGVIVLRWLGCHSAFARLRDVLALFLAAAVAPLASVACSFVARLLAGHVPERSGYDGWWRMNALGVLIVVPLVLTWAANPRPRWSLRDALEGAAIGAAIALGLWTIMVQLPAGPTAIVLLYGCLPVALFAALRFGQRGATAIASLGALLVAAASSHGIGPFAAAPVPDRYAAIQIFDLTLLGVPLLFGSLIAERRANAQRWIRSEGLRAALLNVLPDVVYRIRRDGTVLDAVAPDGVRLPTPRDQLIGRRLDALLAPDLAAQLTQAVEEACRDGRSRPIEYPLRSASGQPMREARFVRLADDEVLGLVRDVTDRAAFQRLLTWQARILEQIATGRPSQEVFAEIVRGIERHLGRGHCSILLLRGRRLHLGCAPSLPQAYNDAVDGVEIAAGIGTCGTAAFENRTVVTADIATDPAWAGFRGLALAHGLRACWSVPIRASKGGVLGTFAIYHDVPQRPNAGEIEVVERAAVLTGIAMEREQREELLASIQRNVAEGLFRFVPGQGLAYANRALAQVFGYASPEQMLATLAIGTGEPAHLADIAALGQERDPRQPDELLLHRRDGSTFWARVSSTLVRGADGIGNAYVGAIADVSGRRQLEEQLRQAQKMEAVGKLAGGIAHDFNNLLTAITGYAESVQCSLPADNPRRRDLGGILDAAMRAAGLTRQLLAFSRQQVLAPKVLDLAALVDEMAPLLERLIGEHIQLRRDRPPGTVPVCVDRSQMEQVILNLVVNARDAIQDGGTVTIGTAIGDATPTPEAPPATGPQVRLWVRDTGTGMDAAQRARAFDPFFTTKPPGRGTGLGLSLVYGIARQSGGDAWIDSTPGSGTTVWIRLPLATDPAEAVAAPPAPPAAAGGATILLVEDEALVRDLIERTLRRAGHSVLIAADGQAALALARQHHGGIDLLITDVVMPVLGGCEVAERLAAERPGLPVLFVSGYTGDGGDLQLGANAQLLHKPFTVQALLAAVNGLLHASARG